MQPTIDEEQIGSLAEMAGVAVVETILDAFWESTNTLTADLGAALGVRDGKRVAELGHALKGSAANIGAARLAVRAREIEDAAKAGDLDRAISVLRSFADDVAATRVAIAETLKRFAA
jgi:HPt (histidine-containing phosphotransfer) domain-containing protein